MSFTGRELWGLVHGIGLGALFLLAFAGGLAELYNLRPAAVTAAGVRERMHRVRLGVVAMAAVAWLTVITGTWVVYPWYRAGTPDSPRSQLLADPATEQWHTFAMEWKEHIAWISPILATVVAFIVVYYGAGLVRHVRVRRTAMALLTLSFLIAGVAGLLGALITKVAPVL
jgi:hypothetical protein